MNQFTFVITGHQALPFANLCIQSIKAQQGSFNISTLYVDDSSGYTDTENKELRELLESVNGTLATLKKRHYQIGSLSKGVPLIKDKQAIVCLLDGDDYLLPHALQTVAKVYKDPNIVMTYGNVLLDFRPYQDHMPDYFFDKRTVNTEYSLEVWKNRSFREDGFRCFHLRTFKRWLWDFIDPKGFKNPSGEFIRASGDSAFVYPMLELLADPKHVAFIDTPIYVYRLHKGNVHNHDKKSQSEGLDLLRYSMKRYEPLNCEILQENIREASCVE
ncbi:MAG: glycosyltransferase family A protein [Waddliaceae bacterium]